MELEKRSRQKFDDSSASASRIFHPFRVLGHVTSDVPMAMQIRGGEFFFTSSVGHAFHIYSLEKMRLKFVSTHTNEQIAALACSLDFTFAACGSKILKFLRARQVSTISAPSQILQLLVFGSHLISIHDDNALRIWEISTNELYLEIKFPHSQKISQIHHPATYLNKILIGTTSGSMFLWNTKRNQMIYEFKSFGSGITVIEQTPVVDVVAIGLVDGSILLHNLKKDKTVMRFTQEDGRVTSIAFRSDDCHHMYTGGMNGKITVWNLDERRPFHILQAHNGSVSSIHFVHGKQSIVTSGSDNAIKQWIFDKLDGTPRILRERSGHSAPPSRAKFYSDDNAASNHSGGGGYIISAGRDSTLRLFCTFRDEQNMEFSQGNIQKQVNKTNANILDLRLSQITNFSSSTMRDRDWDSILTCHLNQNYARTWSFDKKAVGNFAMKSKDGSVVKAATLSPCGNFAVLGCTSGNIDVFNMQSGLYKKSFDNGHTRAISGLAIDATNQKLISCSLDGLVKIWNFISGVCINTIKIDSPVTCIELKRENNLLAISSDDFAIRVMDIENGRIVRTFFGHDNRITDFAFSPDGRWLVSVSVDCVIKTWDIPSGFLIDAFKVKSIPTSVGFSPKADFLITTHSNSVGISLWVNKRQLSNVALSRLPEDFDLTESEMPTAAGNVLTEFDGDSGNPDSAEIIYNSPVQLETSLITFSEGPRTKWSNLLNLDIIKKRNKPLEAPKVPEKAPFFLPTLPGIEPKFAIDKSDNMGDSHVLHMKSLDLDTDLIRLLKSTSEVEISSSSAVIGYMKSLSPTALDFELRSLVSPEDDNCDLLIITFKILLTEMKENRDFEMIQAFFAACLNIYLEKIMKNASLFIEIFVEYEKIGISSWKRIDQLFQSTLCVIDLIRR